MSVKLKVHVVRVFVDSHGQYGNPLGIILDEKQRIDTKERQRIATKLGFSESVFIDDVSTGNISIFNPLQEVSFAGHAIVGTVWFINTILKNPTASIKCSGEKVIAWHENGKTWIRAKLSILPSWNLEQLKSVKTVKNFSNVQATLKQHTVVWAWLDKNKGVVRARTFAPDWGIPEDEANGSGSMQLAVKLGCDIVVIHGRGSVIYVKPFDRYFVEVGGRVIIQST